MGWVVKATPLPLYAPGKTRYPMYRRLGGPESWSGRFGEEKNVCLYQESNPGPSSWLSSRYTHHATLAPKWNIKRKVNSIFHLRTGHKTPALAASLPGKKPNTHCIEGWVGPGAILDGAENLVHTRIQSPDHPAHITLLYPLCLTSTQNIKNNIQ